MLLHSGWHLLYHRFAWMFDFVSNWVSNGQWQALGRTALAFLPPGRVLELAHGPGHLLVALERAGHQPVGIDRSAQMSRQAGRRLRHGGLPRRLIRCDARALPFRAASFAGVVTTFPTDAVLSASALEEVSRVLAPGGRLVIVAGAQRTGDRPDPTFRAWLSGLLGEEDQSAVRPEAIFARAGFRARLEYRVVAASTVFLLVADKAEASVAALVAEAERELRRAARPTAHLAAYRVASRRRQIMRKHLL